MVSESTSTFSSENSIPQADDVMEDVIFEENLEDKNTETTNDLENITKNKSESQYILRNRIQKLESETVRDSFEELETELPVNTNDIEFNIEDLEGATIDDALDIIEGKNQLEYIAEWPNDAYRDFMELIIKGNISNKIGDKIIKFFNKYSNLEKSPLPKSTKNGKDYLNQINSPSVKFKERVVASYSGIDFTLYYQPIFRTI